MRSFFALLLTIASFSVFAQFESESLGWIDTLETGRTVAFELETLSNNGNTTFYQITGNKYDVSGKYLYSFGTIAHVQGTNVVYTTYNTLTNAKETTTVETPNAKTAYFYMDQLINGEF